MNNPAASGGESDPEEIEALEPPCARQGQTSAKVSKGRCGQGAGGVAGGACFSRRRCRRREPLVRHWVVLQRMRSRVVRAWTICTVGLNVGSEAGGISPEISPAWAVYTAGGNWSPHLWRRSFVAVDHGAAIKVWRGERAREAPHTFVCRNASQRRTKRGPNRP
jgi:hypothetical protein